MNDEGQKASYERDVNAAYQALGRYVYEFSRLVFQMRRLMIKGINGHLPLAELALGGVTAQPLADGLFALCRQRSELDEAELKVCLQLQKAVNAVIQVRNDFAHGDWWIGWGSSESTEPDPPFLNRIKASKKSGPIDTQVHAVGTLEEMALDVSRLRNLVGEFADIATGDTTGLNRRVGEFLTFDPETKQVVRNGPRVGTSSVNYP